MRVPLPIKRLHADAIIPRYARAGDAGFDLHALCDVTIPAQAAAIMPTGLAVAVPAGFELQIRLRSSASLHTPLILPNAPATIDSGYRGELGVILRNLSAQPFTVRKGERVAQAVLAPVAQAIFAETEALPPSERGSGGYGSTGK